MSEVAPTTPSAPFTDMARKIDENSGNGFSGAFVIVPPAGDPVELLYLASVPDEAMFWSALKSAVDIALAKIADRERGSGFGGRF